MAIPLTDWIDVEKKSEIIERRLAANLLDQAYDMDWIGMNVDDMGGLGVMEELVSEIKNTEFVKQLLERIYGE